MTLQDAKPDMISRIIGHKGKTIKRIISDSWRMYDNHQSEGGGEKNKPKLTIQILKTDGGLSAEIETDSETMRKFAVHSLRKTVKTIVEKASSNIFRLYAEMSPSCIGMLLGKKALLMRKDLSDVASEIGTDYEEEYEEIARKAWTKVTESRTDDYKSFVEDIRKDSKKSFVGWGPDESDESESETESETEIVEILVSTRGLPENVFLDLVNRLSERLDTRIKRIVSRHQETMTSIEDALGFDEYSPESPR